MKLYERLFEPKRREGIEPPTEPGLKMFLYYLKKYWFSLIGLNLLVFLSMIPILTIGPTTKGLIHVTSKMVKDTPVHVVSDYLEGFRKDFLKSVVWGLTGTFVGLVMILAIFFYSTLALSQWWYGILAVLMILATLYASSVVMYWAYGKEMLSLEKNAYFKNALLLVPISPLNILIMGIGVLSPTIFLLYYFLYGLPLLLFWQFAFNGLLCSMMSLASFKKYIEREN